MKFRNAFSKPKTIYSNIGTPTVPTYKYVLDPDTGRRKWKENGEDNIYEKIQGNKEWNWDSKTEKRYGKSQFQTGEKWTRRKN